MYDKQHKEWKEKNSSGCLHFEKILDKSLTLSLKEWLKEMR